MLIGLMYHRVTGNVDAFEKQLTYLSKHYPIVVPGDKITPYRIHICLTFDDAYYDFYHSVFPLLQKLSIPAVLAIPAGLILDKTNLDDQTRLQVPYLEAIEAYKTHATLCTWNEIQEMVASNLVIPASHGLTHQSLTKTGVDLQKEIVDSKILLQEKTQKSIDTFVYPYGAMTYSLNHFVNQHYCYTMRIGSALNLNWKNLHHVMYRINAEKFWPSDKTKTLLSPWHQFVLGARFMSNILRFK